jgi:hypothetical protein
MIINPSTIYYIIFLINKNITFKITTTIRINYFYNGGWFFDDFRQRNLLFDSKKQNKQINK